MVNTDDIINMTADCAAAMGMEPYYLYRQKNMAGNFENVGYSKPGREGIYNILIMEEKQTIMAVGAGASTKVVFPEENRIERVENVKDVTTYIENIDEMIDRKRRFFMVDEWTKTILEIDLIDGIKHGMCVSNLTYLIAKNWVLMMKHAIILPLPEWYMISESSGCHHIYMAEIQME